MFQAFNQALIALIKTDGRLKQISRGEMLLREGEAEQHIYLIETGTVRVFLLSACEEMTIRFGYEGSIVNSLSSFITGKPSELYIEAIRKTSLRMISKSQFSELVYRTPENMKGYISLMELLVTQQIEREIDLLTISPTVRLQRVLERSPNLFQQVPLKYIASYLRMTPETLSRIRNP
ncbi:MAG: Crp/Fnr family transcriptional regulator [Chitinophagaceae bacterium]